MKMLLALALASLLLPLAACEESHTETTHSNLLGGTTHEETTVDKNPLTGSTSVQEDKTVTH